MPNKHETAAILALAITTQPLFMAGFAHMVVGATEDGVLEDLQADMLALCDKYMSRQERVRDVGEY